ncbi:MAG TPA: hypothetical protein VIC55_05725 [Gemmatimonadaceae bacterium]|jgi:hypothetical protein
MRQRIAQRVASAILVLISPEHFRQLIARQGHDWAQHGAENNRRAQARDYPNVIEAITAARGRWHVSRRWFASSVRAFTP